MVQAGNIRVVGNRLQQRFSDGSVRWFTPTPAGFYVPGARIGGTATVPTGAGESGVPGDTSGSGTPGSVTAPVDDYPYPKAPEDALSPFRYSYRDCTDFVAWRINRDDNVLHAPWKWTWGNLRITNGDAIGWKPDWITHGWDVKSTPTAGMIGWFGTKAGAYGHVNYIQAVRPSGGVHMEEYNWSPNHQAYNQRDAEPGDPYYPDSFLGMPPH